MPSLRGDQITHNFEFNSQKIVPETHLWPMSNDHPLVSEPVPIIDLFGPDTNVVMDLAWACQAWGAFQIIGHGIKREVLERVEAETRRLFALPTAQKLRAARETNGVSGYGLARISCFFSKLMWSEGFTIVGSPLDDAKKLWPQEPYQFCDVINEYKCQLSQLANKLIHLILRSLSTSPSSPELSSVLHLNSYPTCPDPDRAMGLAPHTDSALITLLYQGNTAGLQLLRPPDRLRPTRWVTVPPVENALIIIIGDLLQIMSNGQYQSVVHRAVVNRDQHRVSVVGIYGPPANVRVSPVTEDDDSGRRPARYRAVTWQEYLGLKAKVFDRALTLTMLTNDVEGQGVQ